MTRSPTFAEQLDPRRKRVLWIASSIGLATLLLVLFGLTRSGPSDALADPSRVAASQPAKANVLVAHAEQQKTEPQKPVPSALDEAEAVVPESLPKLEADEEPTPKPARNVATRSSVRTNTVAQPHAAKVAPTKTSSSCNPPYIIDSRGIRHMKIACLRK